MLQQGLSQAFAGLGVSEIDACLAVGQCPDVLLQFREGLCHKCKVWGAIGISVTGMHCRAKLAAAVGRLASCLRDMALFSLWLCGSDTASMPAALVLSDRLMRQKLPFPGSSCCLQLLLRANPR